jgi:Flp pilus assembly pilin Flp
MAYDNPARTIRQFFRCESGTVAVEYGVIVTAMFLALIPGFLYVSSALGLKLTFIKDFFGGA